MAQPSDSTPSASNASAPSNAEPSTSPLALNMPTTPAGILDLLISLHLSLWPALSLAISLYTPPAPSQSNPSPANTGKEVRDWMAGAVSSMIQEGQIRDQDDLEEVILQVVGDEFEVMIEDGSEAILAGRIWRSADRLKSGNPELRAKVEEELRGLWDAWIKKGGEAARVDARAMGKRVDPADEDDDDDDEDGTSAEEDEDEDDEMGDAPDLVDTSERHRRERIIPEVDEDGFTKVVGKKKR